MKEERLKVILIKEYKKDLRKNNSSRKRWLILAAIGAAISTYVTVHGICVNDDKFSPIFTTLVGLVCLATSTISGIVYNDEAIKINDEYQTKIDELEESMIK